MPEKRKREPRKYTILSFREILNIIYSNCGNVFITERHGNGSGKVIILPEALRELEMIVSYGRRSPMNLFEQKFTGYGHFLKDENGNTIIIVSHFIQIHTMNRNAVSASNLGPNGEYNHGLDFLEYYREEFYAYEAKFNTDASGFTVDPFIEICGKSEFVLEGHTHPDLGTFYSHDDRTSGSARAAAAPICIFVCDPIRREMLGSIGKDFEEAEIIVYSRREESACSEEYPSIAGNDPEELVKAASQCLRMPGHTGKVRYYTRFDGKNCLKVKIIISEDKKEGTV